MVSWTRIYAVVVAWSVLPMAVLTAGAVEYRLQVASLYDDAFFALLGSAGSRREGPVPGHPRLLEALDTGKAPAGVLLYDRLVEPARASVATAFGAPRVRAEAQLGGEGNQRWSELRWEGTPGKHSVWVIAPSSIWQTKVRDVALKGAGPLVWAIPHRMASSQRPARAVGIPLGFIQAHEGNPALWERHISPALDLSEGIAIVVGENSSSTFADHVFIVIKHAASPTTYKVVLSWERRAHEFERDDLLPGRRRRGRCR